MTVRFAKVVSLNCGNCRYYAAGDPAIVGELGHCRRHAPTRDARGYTDWPTVQPNQWCGDHELPDPLPVVKP